MHRLLLDSVHTNGKTHPSGFKASRGATGAAMVRTRNFIRVIAMLSVLTPPHGLAQSKNSQRQSISVTPVISDVVHKPRAKFTRAPGRAHSGRLGAKLAQACSACGAGGMICCGDNQCCGFSLCCAPGTVCSIDDEGSSYCDSGD